MLGCQPDYVPWGKRRGYCDREIGWFTVIDVLGVSRERDSHRGFVYGHASFASCVVAETPLLLHNASLCLPVSRADSQIKQKTDVSFKGETDVSFKGGP